MGKKMYPSILPFLVYAILYFYIVSAVKKHRDSQIKTGVTTGRKLCMTNRNQNVPLFDRLEQDCADRAD